jgi:hypothetical protein
MSDQSSSGKQPTGSSKKPTSPARNIIGLVVLVAVVVIGGLEVWAKTRYNTAVKALDARSQDETQGLLTVNEAESLLGTAPDGPGTDVKEPFRSFTKKTYTWNGLLKSYTVTAFYTQGQDPRLHHFESDGAKYNPEPNAGPKPAALNESTGVTRMPPATKEAMPETTESAPTASPAAAESKPADTEAKEPAKPDSTPAPDPAKAPK